MDTIASFFCVYEVISYEVLIKLCVQAKTLIAPTIYVATIAW